MIGLPMGSHKTIVTQDGQLQWSQWSLANKGRAVLFGFSDQMDGALGIQLSELDATGEKPLVAAGQHLVENRFPFPVTNWKGEQLNAEETAFAASVGETGLDVVEITVTNPGGEPRTLELRLNGKQRNLPAFSNGAELSTRDGNLLAVVEPESGVLKATAENDGMTLVEQRVVPAHGSITFTIKLPYDFPVAKAGSLTNEEGLALLKGACAEWEKFWNEGTQIELPAREKELKDFYQASVAYIVMLTERQGPRSRQAGSG